MSELILENVIVEYPNFKLDLSFKAEAGEFVSVIGPSGSGKSTILSVISGLTPIKEGKITLGGRDITHEKIQKRHVGIVFQDYALFENMNVSKNIAYALKFHKMKRKEKKETKDLLLSLVGLEGFDKRKISTLSGGQCQRVALARALATSPEVLLLDEPLSALDANLRRHLKDEIRKIHDKAEGMTTIYVTHDIEEALSISDRIVIIKDGKVEMSARPEEIYQHPATQFTASFSGDGTFLPASLFSDNENYDTIFFRPESVHMTESPFHGDFKMHLCLDNCSVLSTEYRGSRYLVNLDFRGHLVKAETTDIPNKKIVSVYIRKPLISFFKDEKLIN
ncbi:MAG: ABC transporter ATP-binding protein [Sphaerochaetaceae bacterium]|nr:ABC transporter ATP-binding protein [Sphaerochaetaceae bacterium]